MDWIHSEIKITVLVVPQMIVTAIIELDIGRMHGFWVDGKVKTCQDWELQTRRRWVACAKRQWKHREQAWDFWLEVSAEKCRASRRMQTGLLRSRVGMFDVCVSACTESRVSIWNLMGWALTSTHEHTLSQERRGTADSSQPSYCSLSRKTQLASSCLAMLGSKPGACAC